MNVLNFVKPSAKLPRNGFDLSQRHLFSAKAGQLLPILSLECVPGDYHEVNVLEMARSMQVHTDAFCRLKQNFDFYFVPYSQLWSKFPDFMSSREELRSSLQINKQYSSAPHNSLKVVLDNLYGAIQEDVRDMHGFSYGLNGLKLLDLLGYGNHFFEANTSMATTGFTDINVNLFRLAAYQKIFADYYRQPFYDLKTFISRSDYVRSYNFDDVSSSGVAALYSDLFTLHYRQWKKDMFTGLLPSVQFGDVSFVDLGTFNLGVSPAPSTNATLFVNGQSSTYSGAVSHLTSGTPANFTATTQISVYDILKAQALQKWKENVSRAGAHLKDNFQAHYGVTPSYLENTQCEFIGSFDSPLTIDEVVSQSTSNDGLGEIGGKGIGTASGKVKFNCKDFGILMCIYSIVPTAEYNSLMLDRANSNLEHFDFWNPEFDNTGLEAIPFANLSLVNTGFSTAAEGSRHLSHIIGYAPRNLYLKTAIDKVHGQFISALVKEDDSEQLHWYNGVFSHWAIPRRLIGYEDLNLKDYYISPHDLDTIFVQEATDYEDSDQFIVNCNFDVKSVRNMPVLGLPNW